MKKSGPGLSKDKGSLIIKRLLMRKLLILLIFALSLQTFANGYGQDNINLRVEKTQLKKVLKVIENQGIFRFVYQDELLPKDQRVSIWVQHADLAEVMNKLLENTHLTYHRLNDNLVVLTRDMG